ncbi:MAG: indole-3-glycerol-phosphate synthase TrpC, partial [Thermodesulfobacteriota bacterium]
NNRDLTTLKVDINQSLKMFSLIPSNIPVIAESGYNKNKEIKELRKRGFKGVLIGTSLVKSINPKEKLKELIKEVI